MKRFQSFLSEKWAGFLVLALLIVGLIFVSQYGHKPKPLDSSAATPPDVVLYGSDVSTMVGAWSKVTDSAAANGIRVYNPNANAAKISAPQSNPANYFEASFNADAGTPYHLWIRSKADNNDW